MTIKNGGCFMVTLFLFFLFLPLFAGNGLVAYFPLDGDAIDQTSNGHNGTIFGAATIPGVVGKALYFNGTSSYVQIPSAGSLSMTDALSISVWIKPELLNLWYKVVSKSNSQVTDNDWSLGEAMAGGICFSVYKGADQYYTNGGTSLNLNEWNHVLGTWDGSVMRIYQNGKLQSEMVDVTLPINSSEGPLFIGRMPQNTYYFKGAIDELRIFNRAVTPQEADYLYRNAYDSLMVNIPRLILLTPGSSYDQRPLLQWYSNQNFTAYKIQVAATPSFSSPLYSIPVLDTFYQPSVDLPFGTYYWRVGDYSDNSETSFWSRISSFTINDPTIPIAQHYVPNPTRNRKPSLTWNNVNDTTTYTIQVATNPSFILPFIQTMLTNTVYTPTTDLPIGSIYWRVKSGMNDRYSAPDTFLILSDSVPLPISFVPDSQNNRKPVFQWLSAVGASSYRIQIDTLGNFSAPLITLPVSDTFYTPTVDLPYGRIYWRVSAGLAGRNYSSANSFLILKGGITTSHRTTGKSFEGFTMRLVNAGNGVEFVGLAGGPGEISLEIVSLTGRNVALIGQTVASRGNYKFFWNRKDPRGQSVPPGSYVVIARLNGKTAARKIALFK
jgi:hypothetical protein